MANGFERWRRRTASASHALRLFARGGSVWWNAAVLATTQASKIVAIPRILRAGVGGVAVCFGACSARVGFGGGGASWAIILEASYKTCKTFELLAKPPLQKTHL